MTGRGSRGAYYKSLYGSGRGRRRNHGTTAANPESASTRPQAWDDLKRLLAQIDGQTYGAYNQLRGEFQHSDPAFTLKVDHIQGDAYAPPSRVRAIANLNTLGIPASLLSPKVRKIAYADYLTRVAARLIQDKELDKAAPNRGWSGPKGGAFRINAPGQQVLERNSCVINDSDEQTIELRFTISLPAQGRTILGDEAYGILVDAVPELVRKTLLFSSLSEYEVKHHVSSVQDQEHMRSQLENLGLVAFVANGSILPRAGGPYSRPMSGPNVVPFRISPEHEVSLQRLDGSPVYGLGIPHGVTVLSGGGFHGKSTLLEALELGIYNHIPGDGRELVVTDPTAVKIRAEDGRSVFETDISPYMANQPGGQDTRKFTTRDASGSTSMAANIQEALEADSTALLIDEDSSATNLLVRDERMQALIHNEPIIPMISRVRALTILYGISTIIVIGGLGDWLSVADNVIVMDSYQPSFRNKEAKLVCLSHLSAVQVLEDYGNFTYHSQRLPQALLDSKGPFARRKDFITIPGLNDTNFRTNSDAEPGIDLSSIDQLVETGQTHFLAAILANLAQKKSAFNLIELLKEIRNKIEHDGLDSLVPNHSVVGDWVQVRPIEVAAMLCRLRGLKSG